MLRRAKKISKDRQEVKKKFAFAGFLVFKDGQGSPVSDAQPTIRIQEITVGGVVT